MEPMLDKDFDAFFKSSFEDYEITPAKDSWEKISDKINSKSAKKKSPFFWMAAASIIIVLGIGIGFYTKPTEVIKLHPDGKNEMMTNLAQEQKKVTKTTEELKPVASTIKKAALNPVIVNKSAKKNTTAEHITKEEPALNNKPLIKELALIKNVKSVRPKLMTEQLMEQEEITKLEKSKPVILEEIDHSLIANASTEKPSSTKKIGISSVGDLVNFVVAKVDKRGEKLIVMSKTTESDNEITGINLGLFKFRKQD